MKLSEAASILQLSYQPLPKEADVKTAYKKQALLHHPDKNVGDPNASKKFIQVKEAADTLLTAIRNPTSSFSDADRDVKLDEEDDYDSSRDFWDDDKDEEMVRIMVDYFLAKMQQEGTPLRKREKRWLESQIRGSILYERFIKEEAAHQKRVEAAAAAAEAASAAFWASQQAANPSAKPLHLGGEGCYLDWHPKQLQREVSKRRLKLKKGESIPHALLEDDCRRRPTVGSEVGFVNVATKRTTPLEKKEAFHKPFGKEWVAEKAKKKAKERKVEGRLGDLSRYTSIYDQFCIYVLIALCTLEVGLLVVILANDVVIK